MNKNEFKKGDIVTYDGCPTTIAIFDHYNDELNVSGDKTYKPIIAVVGEFPRDNIYHDDLIISNDIRLANNDEKIRFFERLSNNVQLLKNIAYKNSNILDIIKLKNELDFQLKETIEKYNKYIKEDK